VTSESGYVTVWVVCAALALTVAGLAASQHRDSPLLTPNLRSGAR